MTPQVQQHYKRLSPTQQKRLSERFTSVFGYNEQIFKEVVGGRFRNELMNSWTTYAILETPLNAQPHDEATNSY
ncbi:MAG: hypothetical protein U0Y10_17550 [Spirosomataceae bacterium]